MSDDQDVDVMELPERDSNMPGTRGGMMFHNYLFNPVKGEFNSDDLMNILASLQIIFPPEMFNALPEHTKQHFIVQGRDGTRIRWSKRLEQDPKKKTTVRR